VLAAFRHVDDAAGAIRSLKEMGYRDFTVYTPVPNHEIASAVGHKISPVRVWTLVGGLTGVTLGFAMTLWMSLDYPVVVGGKPIPSVIPYVVIAFELTILCGALATIAGLIVHIVKNRKAAAFDPRFTDDHIGIFVPCATERRDAVQQMLQTSGAEEVRVEA
jgi:molybdopterin-containing oxidoreductase family membrane subunit